MHPGKCNFCLRRCLPAVGDQVLLDQGYVNFPALEQAFPGCHGGYVDDLDDDLVVAFYGGVLLRAGVRLDALLDKDLGDIAPGCSVEPNAEYNCLA